ncbi:MAG: hypothetical protein R2822_12895 [Spirosomataceae bacterium]
MDTLLGRIRTIYLIDEGRPYRLREVNILTNNGEIDSLLKQSQALSLIKTGNNYRNGDIISKHTHRKIDARKWLFWI